MTLLDSPSQLTNVKNRFGLRIIEGNSTSVYLAQSRLRKFLNEKLKSSISYDYDRCILIDKIVDRCEDITVINSIYELLNEKGNDYFVTLASGKIRPFFKDALQYAA